MSLMEPLMKEILLRDSARLSSLPAERSSRTTTLSPRRTSSSTVLDPMKPAPPVTTYRIRAVLQLRTGRVTRVKFLAVCARRYCTMKAALARFCGTERVQEKHEPPSSGGAGNFSGRDLRRSRVCVAARGRAEQDHSEFHTGAAAGRQSRRAHCHSAANGCNRSAG